MEEQPQSFQLSPPADKNHHKRVILYGLAVILLVIIGGAIGFKLGVNNATINAPLVQQKQIPKVQSINQYHQERTPTQVEEVSQNEKAWKIYTNQAIGYKLSYPTTASISASPDETSADVSLGTDNDIVIYAEYPDFFGVDSAGKVDPSDIMQVDLECSAGGPEGAINCTNNNVADFMTASGIHGWLAERTLSAEGEVAKKIQSGSDPAYVFPSKNPAYPYVLLIVGNPTPDAIAILGKVATSFSYTQP